MKRKINALLVTMVLLSLAVLGTACGSEKKDPADSGVSGNTYVFESYTVDGEAVPEEMASMMEGSSYAFKEDGTLVYTISFGGMESEVNGTYTQDGENVKVTLDYGEEGTVDMDFTEVDGKLTFSETTPAYDDEGEAIEGQTTTSEQVYIKQ